MLLGASRNRCLLRGRVLLVGIAMAVSGCASTGNPPEKQEATEARDEKHGVGEALGAIGGAALGGIGGAAGGALYGARCGPAFFVCAPVGAVIGAGFGLAKGAQVGAELGKSLAGSTRSGRAPRTDSDESPQVPRSGKDESLQYVGELPDSEFSPPGSLFIETHRIQVDGMRRTGILLVNLEKPEEQSAKSIEADVEIDCEAGGVNFVKRRTYDYAYGSGRELTAQQSTTGMAPGPQLNAVRRIICGYEPST